MSTRTPRSPPSSCGSWSPRSTRRHAHRSRSASLYAQQRAGSQAIRHEFVDGLAARSRTRSGAAAGWQPSHEPRRRSSPPGAWSPGRAVADLEVLLVHRPTVRRLVAAQGQGGRRRARDRAPRCGRCSRRPASTSRCAGRCPSDGTRSTVRPKVVHYWRAESLVEETGSRPTTRSTRSGGSRSTMRPRSVIARPTTPSLVKLANDPPGTPVRGPAARPRRQARRTGRARTSTDRWTPPVSSRPRRWSARLAAYGVARVHSSAARRCSDTVRPYSLAAGVPLVVRAGADRGGLRGRPAGLPWSRAAGLLADAWRTRRAHGAVRPPPLPARPRRPPASSSARRPDRRPLGPPAAGHRADGVHDSCCTSTRTSAAGRSPEHRRPRAPPP